jgi:Predicted membrane protein
MNKYFIDVIRNHYLDFKGSATGKDFLWYIIWYIVCVIILGVLASVLGKVLGILGTIFCIIHGLYHLLLLCPSIAILVRFLRGMGVIK